MKSSYLIQRLNRPYKGEPTTPLQAMCKYGLSATGLGTEARKALSEVCVFDYMGSAEYEFGAIPKALREMALQCEKLEGHTIPCTFSYKDWRAKDSITGNREVYVICKDEDYTEVKQRIRSFAMGVEHCKERTEVAGSLAEYEYNKDTVGWMDLDNGFMFFKDKEMYENFLTLMDVKAVTV